MLLAEGGMALMLIHDQSWAEAAARAATFKIVKCRSKAAV
jgi:hypothetical protein